ncbi:MAG: PAS domain S-box protein [Candidatus Acidiferrum sp.]
MFFAFSLIAADRQSRVFLAVIPIILVCALALHAYYLFHAGRERHAIADAFYVTDREFASVFEQALDGILIIDNHAACINANPAALRILDVSSEELLGSSLARFFIDQQAFTRVLNQLLDGCDQRGHAELLRAERKSVPVDYAVAANYVPGRHVAILSDTTERRMAEASLRQSEERFQLMAKNIQEVFWMLRLDTKKLVYVSDAYETITGHPLAEIQDDPSSYTELVHPEDRDRFLAKLDEARSTGRFNEEFRIVRPDGRSRWIWSKGTRAADFENTPPWLVGIAQDITARKNAELEIEKHLAAAEAARAEAEALRRSTVALTKNLSMDKVLDTLLACVSEVVPYSAASVILTEGEDLYVARTSSKTVQMLEGQRYTFLDRVRAAKKSVFVTDAAQEPDWEDVGILAGLRSWICVPLVASTERSKSERVLGLLSIGHSRPLTFTAEHFRIAQSLAVAAAVAIQNARLYERAEIYAAELETLTGKQGEWQARKAKDS